MGIFNFSIKNTISSKGESARANIKYSFIAIPNWFIKPDLYLWWGGYIAVLIKYAN